MHDLKYIFVLICKCPDKCQVSTKDCFSLSFVHLSDLFFKSVILKWYRHEAKSKTHQCHCYFSLKVLSLLSAYLLFHLHLYKWTGVTHLYKVGGVHFPLPCILTWHRNSECFN